MHICTSYGLRRQGYLKCLLTLLITKQFNDSDSMIFRSRNNGKMYQCLYTLFKISISGKCIGQSSVYPNSETPLLAMDRSANFVSIICG